MGESGQVSGSVVAGQVQQAGPSHRIVLAGGGTAGHVNPLLAVAAAIRELEPQAQISVIGTNAGLEHELVPAAGFELDPIEKLPFPRRPNAAALRFPGRWLRTNRKVRAILESRQAQIVAGFGGYASAPVYQAAHRMKLPIVVHEQNARAGMANRLGARWASFVGTAFEGTGLKVGSGGRLQRVGLPLRPTIAQLCLDLQTDRSSSRQRAAAALGVDPERPVVLVTGGSLGALSINRAVAGSASELLEHAQLVHLTGKGKMDEVRQQVSATAGPDVMNDLDPGHKGQGDYHLAEYLERIDLAFACADLVICRSGAGSVCELAALGLPAIYVPLPIGNGEQRFNAEPVVRAGGGLLVDDGDFNPDWIRSTVPELLSDPDRLKTMGGKAWTYGIRDAAQVMAGKILDLAAGAGN
ncbi:UDP-N-acetylglucosamine--N-acetylmuramyl-(pentapeptide) pyrophosphoryl-undecaprenol N-acetylglucosamine transferase [Bifidobacterium aemilianum]|uniref:UDP-N-acetylglucosamine--N-acetylmuramyl-(pentapeptide) pyrophosphoryl-undecaprenol N-acetylglucosamine transferase n=1 Tax=Bifidobacterium aemilianum TaxID=2493120 RepID=A0A366KAB9_9BIFI|nr:UDP-N-acetylglucosamine--N-acetylmuramyl-(pentapeptide) pyrophosphoryl-undecaprenol N-acetylglucosamine transferase [Bifidobacterium aemilianum]RBP98549.1 UDP-N-acetylglucosamine--N-acetylmuramyl-(pentapeptide) pyrophosphoryl-undecaprenol N-acetylglucosamine transferase [Bifidobacterium aemilianum]